MSLLLGTVIGMAEMFLSRGAWQNIRTANHTHIHHERQKKQKKKLLQIKILKRRDS